MSLNNKNNENNKIQEFRCSKCFLIPFIQFFVKNNNLIMKMKCFNNHESTKIIKEIETNEKYFFCNKCKENSNEKKQKNFFYCEKCLKIFCEDCKNFHNNNNNNHKLINVKMIDNFCFEHEKNFIGFCLNHNKNFCKDCSHFKENEIKFFSDFNENEINDCLKNIFNNLKYESFFNNNLNTFELLQILNEKTQNDFNLDLNQSNTSINLENFYNNNNNKSFVNLNNNAIDKIINKYEDKLYFYESLFNFIENYLIQAKMKKLLKNLNKENPKSLGIIIEYICKENFCLKNKINKLINI